MKRKPIISYSLRSRLEVLNNQPGLIMVIHIGGWGEDIIYLTDHTYLTTPRMQDLQNLCPHEVCIGSRRAAKQTGHMYFRSMSGSNMAS